MDLAFDGLFVITTSTPLSAQNRTSLASSTVQTNNCRGSIFNVALFVKLLKEEMLGPIAEAEVNLRINLE